MTQPHPGPNGWQQLPPQQAPPAGWVPMGAVPQQGGPVPPPQKPKRSHGKLGALVLLAFGLVAACTMVNLGGGTSTPKTPTALTGAPSPNGTFNGVPAAVAPVPAPVVLQPARKISARDWQKIAKDPDAHTGERLVVYGQVTQFDSVTGTEGFRANVDGVERKVKYGFADYDTNTILHSDDASVLGDVVQGDLFKAEVTVAGTLSYQTTMGGTMTAPKLTVTKISNIGHVD